MNRSLGNRNKFNTVEQLRFGTLQRIGTLIVPIPGGAQRGPFLHRLLMKPVPRPACVRPST